MRTIRMSTCYNRALVTNFVVLFLLFVHKTVGKFDPYADNGGTLVGIAGRDFCILACDTRLSDAYVIKSRNLSRIIEVSDGVLLSASGCMSDFLELKQILIKNTKSYEWENREIISVNALSSLLAFILYSRRTFPYFSFCAVAGLDSEGHGALYRYDAVGSYERVRAVCVGKGEKLIQPLLDEITKMDQDIIEDSLWTFSDAEDSFDSAVGSSTFVEHSILRNINGKKETSRSEKNFDVNLNFDEIEDQNSNSNSYFSVDDACRLIKKAFRAAAEREISVGDGCEIWILRKNKIVSDCRDSKEMQSKNIIYDKSVKVIGIENNFENMQESENIKTYEDIICESVDDDHLSNRIDPNLNINLNTNSNTNLNTNTNTNLNTELNTNLNMKSNRIEDLSDSNDINNLQQKYDDEIPPKNRIENDLITNLKRKQREYSFGKKKFRIEKQFFSLPLH